MNARYGHGPALPSSPQSQAEAATNRCLPSIFAFFVGSTMLQMVPMSDGKATFTTGLLSAGKHTIAIETIAIRDTGTLTGIS